jgi:hypothetical protein
MTRSLQHRMPAYVCCCWSRWAGDGVFCRRFILVNGAFHAVSWGLVYVWTSFFGLLRDDKPLNEFMVWYVAPAADVHSMCDLVLLQQLLFQLQLGGLVPAIRIPTQPRRTRCSRGVVGRRLSAAPLCKSPSSSACCLFYLALVEPCPPLPFATLLAAAAGAVVQGCSSVPSSSPDALLPRTHTFVPLDAACTASTCRQESPPLQQVSVRSGCARVASLPT